MSERPDLTYPAILNECAAHTAEGRAESRAFLAWFLEHYYRLEEPTAQDCVCDGPDDKGVDGIYVDDNLERVDILQARLVHNPSKTIGDRSLRELAGFGREMARVVGSAVGLAGGPPLPPPGGRGRCLRPNQLGGLAGRLA